MATKRISKAIPKVIFREFVVKKSEKNGIIIDDYFFVSKILSYFICSESHIYAYCISTQEKKPNYDSMRDIEMAEDNLLTMLSSDITNPKCINPGVIFDWNIKETEKIIHLLELKNVKYSHKKKCIVPFQTKIGFVFSAPAFFLGNCEFCLQQNCVYRKFPYNQLLKKKIQSAS